MSGSYGRGGASIAGMLAGIVILVGAFPLLFWNEGRAVKRYRALKEGAGIVVSASPQKVDGANEGKLVHVAGRAVTEEVLSDDVFGVEVNAIKLRRNVTMYQWKERKESRSEKENGETRTRTTYHYDRVWSDKLIDSSRFERSGHTNPSSMPYREREATASQVALGDYTLSPGILAKISAYEALPVGDLPSALQPRGRLHDGGIYLGADPGSPQIGDVKIGFQAVPSAVDVSLVAAQSGRSFKPYVTSQGGSIELVSMGIHGAREMFETAQRRNTMLTWALRVGGVLAMFLGMRLILGPLTALMGAIPVLGNLVGMGITLVAFLVAVALSVLTAAVAWMFYRPLLAAGLVVGALAILFAVRWMSGRQEQTA